MSRLPAERPERRAAARRTPPEVVRAQGLPFATNQDAGEVAVIDSARDAVVEVIPVGREPWEPYETPDHAKILVPNLADRTVSVIDAATDSVTQTVEVGERPWGIAVICGRGVNAAGIAPGPIGEILRHPRHVCGDAAVEGGASLLFAVGV